MSTYDFEQSLKILQEYLQREKNPLASQLQFVKDFGIFLLENKNKFRSSAEFIKHYLQKNRNKLSLNNPKKPEISSTSLSA